MTATAPRRPSFTPGARSATRIPPTRAEIAQRLDDIARERFATHGPHMLAFIAQARAFREKWGTYTSDGWLFDKIVRNGRYVSEYDENKIREAMRRTETRAAARAEKAKAAPYLLAGDNDMSDAEVAAAIRLLTRADSDHARDANGAGWSACDSSAGHYCYAMLSIDYAAAIALGRTLVGKYQRQLRMGGVL